MKWADFYLLCFAGGFFFSLLSFLMGSFHLPHLPHGASGGHLEHGGVAHHGGGGRASVKGVHVSRFNLFTLAAFLAWFGGTGYLLTRYSTIWFVFGLGTALLSGATGGAIIYMFLSRVLMSEGEEMDPADYEMTGVLGRISIPIRAGGTGEIIYSQAGTRRTCGARAENASAIAQGTEVVVTRYEKGIAYVRLWTELAGDDETAEHSGQGAPDTARKAGA
jgi:membrane protein implicated in regulation of membrane protease activity